MSEYISKVETFFENEKDNNTLTYNQKVKFRISPTREETDFKSLTLRTHHQLTRYTLKYLMIRDRELISLLVEHYLPTGRQNDWLH